VNIDKNAVTAQNISSTTSPALRAGNLNMPAGNIVERQSTPGPVAGRQDPG
jgi:hypothetical protein